MGPPLDDLIDELSQEINRTGPALAWEDARFLAWAERIATFQAALRPQLQEPPPRPLHSLEQIPALTTDVFRYAELGTLDRPPAVVFQTSGTLAAFRGRHALPRVDLYAASILAAFDHRVPEAARCRRLGSRIRPWPSW
jgi:hypothetical protein